MTRNKKILLYKILCVAFAAVLLMMPQQQSYSDIRVLATVLGIDGRAGDIEVSAQLAVPVSQSGDGQASTVARAKGGSLSEALENLEIGLGRRIDYGHLSTVAIGQGMLLTDVCENIGYLISSGRAGAGAYLVYCSASPAADFIEQAQKMGESSDAEVSNFVSYNKNGNHVTTTTTLKFLQTLHSMSHAAVMPCVRLEEGGPQPSDAGRTGVGGGRAGESEQHKEQAEQSEKNRAEEEAQTQKDKERVSDLQEEQGEEKASDGGNAGDSKSGEKQEESKSGERSGGDGQKDGGNAQTKKLVSVDSVAAFGGDRIDALELDRIATKGVVWQDKSSEHGLVEIRNVVLDGKDVQSVPARLVKKNVRRKVSCRNGENTLHYIIKVRLRLDDSRICGKPLFFDKWKNALEKEFESVIESNVYDTVALSKRENIDFLGLREHFHKFCKKGYETFKLSDVMVTVDARVTIIS